MSMHTAPAQKPAPIALGTTTIRLRDRETGAVTLRTVCNVASNGSIYSVARERHTTVCNCPDYIYRCRGKRRTCKHIDAAERFLANGLETDSYNDPFSDPPGCEADAAPAAPAPLPLEPGADDWTDEERQFNEDWPL